MHHVTVTNSQIALMSQHGKLRSVLGPGRYSTFGGRTYECFDVSTDLFSNRSYTAESLKAAAGAQELTFVDVPDHSIALHYVDGSLIEAVLSGKHAFSNRAGKHEFKIYDISGTDVPDEFDDTIFSVIPASLYQVINVNEYSKALVYVDNKFRCVLDAGKYYFWSSYHSINFDYIDTRLLMCDIPSQEMLTRDKVTIRINFVCCYKITDYVKIYTEIDDYEHHLYNAAQLALREYISTHTLDEILDNKKEISRVVGNELTAKAADMYMEIKYADVKDIILPGEIRAIMNSVITAEKQAQANVITRREEVASTRSLLNTAKLMEENQTLYKLKELEYVEKICRNVGNINVTGGGDLLAQLTEILRGHKEN